MRDLDNDRLLPKDETPALVEAKVKRFRDVLKAEKIEVPRTDDRFLLAFLRARKFEIFRAAALAANFMEAWHRHVDLIKRCRLENLKDFIAQEMAVVLPGKAHDESTLQLLIMENLDADKYHPGDNLLMNWYQTLSCFDSEDLQRHGLTIVEDMAGLTLRKAMKLRKVMSSKEQKEMMKMFQDVVPLKMKGIYMVNQPWYVSMLFAIVKPFMKKKLRQRIHFLGKPFKLQKVAPMTSLPKSLGGSARKPPHPWQEVRKFMEVKGWHPFFARIPLDSPFRKELGIPDDVYISPEEDTIISEADAVKVMPKKKRKKIIRRRRKKAAGGAVGGGGGGGAGDAVDPDDVEFEEIELDTDEDDDGVEMVEVEGKAEE